MKKILVIIVCLIIVNNVKSQVADTSKYLIDSIENKKVNYIGKPFSVLLKKLKIQPKTFDIVIPLKKVDSINVNSVSVDFINSDLGFAYTKNNVKFPSIDVKFQTPIRVPKSWFMPDGKFFEYKWNTAAKTLFWNLIISKLDVRGI